MSAFTPGPWRVLENSWSDTSIVASGFDHGICRLDINHATEASQEADAELMAANARLIAASPELLAACVAIFEWNAREEDHAVDFYARMELYRAAITKVQAAIEKATGEETP